MVNMSYYTSPSVQESEEEQVAAILHQLDWGEDRAKRVNAKTTDFITGIRASASRMGEVETFLQNYPLASPEGRALMTLAEALLRIPDHQTADHLIAEKLAVSDWKKIGGTGFFASASSFGLGLAKSMLGGFLSGVSKPVIRKATLETLRRLGAQFVVGETIEAALKLAQKKGGPLSRMSFDMLGEGARTIEDAERYYKSYITAAHAIADANHSGAGLLSRHGMSVKLSALHPRYSWLHREDCVPVIVDRLLQICKIAASRNFTLTVDAEESERLELSLEIFARVATSPQLGNWEGFGLAVQAYDRRALSVIDHVLGLSQMSGRRLQIRLVKGAYWDGEIKRAQISGWQQYPVFTRKIHTDLSYLCCAQKMLAARHLITPMFATHNAASAAAILDFAGENRSGFEMQQLFGMGADLGHILRNRENVMVAEYAPVGSYEDLLPYLVRRMLENGANTSFVSQIRNPSIPSGDLCRDPVDAIRRLQNKSLPLPLPSDVYKRDHTTPRLNARGYDLSRSVDYRIFLESIPKKFKEDWKLSDSKPSNPSKSSKTIDAVFKDAKESFLVWNREKASKRATDLRKASDLLEENTGALIYLLQSEAKKTLLDSIAEVREAVDFLRYYAACGEADFSSDGQTLTGPTGERNKLYLTGRGVFVAISPWNFPLAIFLGQIAAALMAGNSVIAKPAEQTPRIAEFVVHLMHRAGIPETVLHLVQGDGEVGAELVAHPDVAGVVFTGSSGVARLINRTLAEKDGAIVPFIAETGGQNAMIADSTALPEQILDDVLTSAFGSAGQRCSALRVLYLQEDIADKVIHLIRGALPLLRVGAPQDIKTDIPPVIDGLAHQNLERHRLYLDGFATHIASASLSDDAPELCFAPCVYEIDSLDRLKAEIFGPILHIIRYKAENLDQVIAEINSTGYGLTFGIQSRLQSRHEEVIRRVRAGNIYINRNMIGAVVGVQPFGGQGLSGTGPKAGGPHYLHRFGVEVTVTDNIMATGGNIDLLSSLEE